MYAPDGNFLSAAGFDPVATGTPQAFPPRRASIAITINSNSASIFASKFIHSW